MGVRVGWKAVILFVFLVNVCASIEICKTRLKCSSEEISRGSFRRCRLCWCCKVVPCLQYLLHSEVSMPTRFRCKLCRCQRMRGRYTPRL